MCPRFSRQALLIVTLLALAAVLAVGIIRLPRRGPRFASGDEVRAALVGQPEEAVRTLLGEPDAVGGATRLGEKEVWQYDSICPHPVYIHIGPEGRVTRVAAFGRGVE
jgi:hypothetical protein